MFNDSMQQDNKFRIEGSSVTSEVEETVSKSEILTSV